MNALTRAVVGKSYTWSAITKTKCRDTISRPVSGLMRQNYYPDAYAFPCRGEIIPVTQWHIVRVRSFTVAGAVPGWRFLTTK